MILGNILGYIMMAIVIFVYLVVASFVMWMAIDAGKQDKFWWMLIIFGIPVIGAVAYYFTEKKGDYAKIPKVS